MLVVTELGFFSSVFFAVVAAVAVAETMAAAAATVAAEVGTDDESEDEDDEFCRERVMFERSSLSDGVNAGEFFLCDDASDELSSEETSNGSNVSEPKTG